MPCETLRFAWRNEGAVLPVFSASSRREAKRPSAALPITSSLAAMENRNCQALWRRCAAPSAGLRPAPLPRFAREDKLAAADAFLPCRGLGTDCGLTVMENRKWRRKRLNLLKTDSEMATRRMAPYRFAPDLGGSGAKPSRPLALSRMSAPPTLAA